MNPRGLFLAAVMLAVAGCGTVPAADPGEPVTGSAPAPDSAFRVTAPLLLGSSGPGPATGSAPCTPSDINASATTRPVAGGVAGVIRLQGRHCSLNIPDGPTALLSADGTVLAVPAHHLPDADSLGLSRPDLVLADGDALLGFSWTGSWCGPRAEAVLVPMNEAPDTENAGSFGDLRVALAGPQPACVAQSMSRLTQGVVGFPGGAGVAATAVLPPPDSWSRLTATLTVPSTVPAAHPFSYDLTLRNPTATPIALSPCPDYGGVISVQAASGSGEWGLGGPLPCTATTSVPAEGAVTFRLPAGNLSANDGEHSQAGNLVALRVAIAGVAPAQATTHIG